jgi:hypothetical protein
VVGAPGPRHSDTVTTHDDDPDVAELAHLDTLLPSLIEEADAAYRAYVEAKMRLEVRQRDRAVLADAVRLRKADAAATVPAPPSELPLWPAPAPPPAPSARHETSTRTVQSVLFVLGGLLLAIAAIVFTAVAWVTFGVAGRATILGVATVLTLSVPLLALSRRLVATAETFAAIGMLFLLLDGYAVRAVNLFGASDALMGTTYYGIVLLVVAGLAVGYQKITVSGLRLTGPRLAALLAAQPALPLLIARLEPPASGWAACLAAVATFDLAVAFTAGRAARDRWVVRVLTVLGWLLFFGMLGASTIVALIAIGIAQPTAPLAWACAVVGLVAVLLVVGGIAIRIQELLVIAAILAGVEVAVAVWRFGALLPDRIALLGTTAIAAGIALVALAVPAGKRLAPLVTGNVVLGLFAVAFGLFYPLFCFISTVDALRWGWSGALDRTTTQPFAVDWQVPAAQLIITVVAVWLVPAVLRWSAVMLGAAAVAVTLPVAVALAWWTPPLLAGVVVVPLTVIAVLARRARVGVPAAVIDTALAGYAVLVSFTRPQVAAATLAGVVLLGATVVVVGGRTRRGRVVSGLWLAAGVLALPAMAATALAALTASGHPISASTTQRCAMAAVVVGLGVALAVRWLRPVLIAYSALASATAATVMALTMAVLALVRGQSVSDPVSVYAALGLLVGGCAAALCASGVRAGVLAVAGPAGVVAAGALTPAVGSVLALPYGWTDRIWSGRPNGVGLAPSADWSVHHADVLALVLVSAALAVLAIGRDRWPWVYALVPTALAVPVAAAAYGLRWPGVQLMTLAIGVMAGLVAALYPRRARRGVVAAAATLGLFATGAGLAGSLAVKEITLVALATRLGAAIVAGLAGRSLPARVNGWLVTVAAAPATAFTAARVADLGPVQISFAVLAAAALCMLGDALLGPRSDQPVRVLGVGAHVIAFVVVVVNLGTPARAATLCTVWGIAIGLRALWPGLDVNARRGLVGAAAGCDLLGWWLLLVANRVAVVEAYTLPLAAVALFVGWLALRARPELRSWLAYGPALAAAFLPSLAPILVTEGTPQRRLLLGVAALAVLVAGAVRRRQAPVVAGGVVVAVVAVHELVLIWQRLQTWIPLSLAGLVLLVLAMTYERRRREFVLVRDNLKRMN